MEKIVEGITLAEVRVAKPDTIFYGAMTCWWTHDPTHLGRTVGEHGLPSDPRGGVLFQTEDVEGFLRCAEEDPGFYGRHGLRAFMAAHHLNCRRAEDDSRPWCMGTWDEYNEALDALDGGAEEVKG